jgi:hypothetical protein
LIVLIIEKPDAKRQLDVIPQPFCNCRTVFPIEKTILLQTHPGAAAVKLQRARRALIGEEFWRGIACAYSAPRPCPIFQPFDRMCFLFTMSDTDALGVRLRGSKSPIGR